jgi:phage-related tail protein
MTILRRLLGVFVMIAGVIGLLLSLAGLVGIWMAKPVITSSLDTTIATLSSTVDTSKDTLAITHDALGATIDSVDGLSEMLVTTAATVEDTQPVLTEVNLLMGVTLPETLQAATDSLLTAEQAAKSLESAIVSFETFQAIIGATPILNAFVPATQTTYSPEKPLADSLGELAVSIAEIPPSFEVMSTELGNADDNLDSLKGSLETMSQSVSRISDSLEDYQAMISQSQASMDNIKSMLTNVQSSLDRVLTATTIVLVLFFLWLLAAQVVIFSQGYELYRGTASRMETGSSD